LKRFLQQLGRLNPGPDDRRWLYVPYDQLSRHMGPLSRESPRELAVILIENPAKAARRPYHRQKLAWILCHQRQFALELAQSGVHVDYRVGEYRTVLQQPRPGGVRMMEAAEWELRHELEGLPQLDILPHEGWLTRPEQFMAGSSASGEWRMDRFYRRVRQDTGILMQRGKPVGGKYSFDHDNRQPWKGQPAAPLPPRYPRDELRLEVEELIEQRYSHHPGHLDTTSIPLSQNEIEHFWAWVKAQCLPWFGPFEDAMSQASSGLFHSRLSPLLNLHRLLPRRVVDEVVQLELPLAGQEGFIRQILGWREFVHHLHHHTQGFRTLPGNLLNAHQSLFPAYWGRPSGLNCLDSVVADVWREGWSHHITRLMVLSNLATLLDVNPAELNHWFWVAYIDAFDWVVEPNVLGMGTYSLGPLMTTKPYVSGAAYLDRMSDYCSACVFHPKKNCPITPLYWAFLERHREHFLHNPRMAVVMRSLQRRPDEQKKRDRQTFEAVSRSLSQGHPLSPVVEPSE